MPSRRSLLQGLVCLPFAARGWSQTPLRPGRGYACALGEDADASLLPHARRDGESLAIALAATPRPSPEILRKLTGTEAPSWVELSPQDRGGVDDGPLAERIRTAASVTLIEGEVIDWLVTLWPARRSSAVLEALAECALTGGRLIGRGSTAILVAAGGVVRGPTREARGESRLRLVNPRESGEPRLTQGLHLCGNFYIDTRARSSGSLLRLLSTLIENHEDRGVMLGDRSVLCCDLEERVWTALGAGPLLVLELLGSRRLSESIQDAELSVLSNGDGRRALDRRMFSTGAPIEFGAAAAEAADADGLLAANLVAPPLVSRSWRNDRMRVALLRATQSSACSGPEDGAPRSQRMVLNVALERGRWGELGS
ncbi:MAG TPA: hypothetical protein VK843_21685 [Planctomycetota bacterium]|nr:hypothetical protein [Planctomycetota bacterium]